MKWHCPPCGGEWETPDDVGSHFHACTPSSTRARQWTPPELEGTTLEDVWRSVFADFAGGYRPPTAEEARSETGETGRRKPGTGFNRGNVDDGSEW